MRLANKCRRAVIELRAGTAAATIDPERGGRLASLRIGDRELLVGPADAADRSIRWGCFLMAPWPGRLADARLRFGGVTHQLARTHGRHAIHGLVWSVPWTVGSTDRAATSLATSLECGGWPFGGEVRQTFHLRPDGVTMEASVVAGPRPMPAALGWHPWFRRDAAGGEPSLSLDSGELLERRRMLPTGAVIRARGATDLRSGPRLGRRRLDDAYIDVRPPAVLAGSEREIWLQFGTECRIVVVYTAWNAVCVEPQTAEPNALGLDDAAGRRAGRRDLAPGEVLTATMTIGWS